MNNEMNKEQQELLDDAYNDYCSSFSDSIIEPNTKELFIEKCKHNVEYSIRWGLKIEERDLTTVRERKKYDIHFDDLFGEYPDHHETLDKRGVPRKLITITYNDKIVESYE